MPRAWTTDELRALAGEWSDVAFFDADRRRLPPPPDLVGVAAPTDGPHWVQRIDLVHRRDTITALGAYGEALRQPGVPQEIAVRVPVGDRWVRRRHLLLNLLDDPTVAALVVLMEAVDGDRHPAGAGPWSPLLLEEEVPWAHFELGPRVEVISAEGPLEQLCGIPVEELTGRSPIELVHPDDVVLCVAKAQELADGDVHTGSIVHRVRHADGSVIQVRSTMTYHPDTRCWTLAWVDHLLEARRELLRALREDQFVVHYQPVVALPSGRIVGAEALVRWVHPERGTVPPLEFIDLAEATGLIIPLGEHVLRVACHEATNWPADLQVAVNLSVHQLMDETIIERVRAVLAETGLAADRLILEVTESALMEDAERASEHLHALADLGVRLAIDDFGTGYSSLVYLKRMPVSTIKVDRCFVDGLGRDADDTAIVASVVSLARAIGVDVVAEGVETTDQRDQLFVLGCALAQGYLWARPRPAEEFRATVARSRPSLDGDPAIVAADVRLSLTSPSPVEAYGRPGRGADRR